MCERHRLTILLLKGLIFAVPYIKPFASSFCHKKMKYGIRIYRKDQLSFIPTKTKLLSWDEITKDAIHIRKVRHLVGDPEWESEYQIKYKNGDIAYYLVCTGHLEIKKLTIEDARKILKSNGDISYKTIAEKILQLPVSSLQWQNLTLQDMSHLFELLT